MLESAIAFLEQQQDSSGEVHDAGSEATDTTAPELIKEEEYAGDVCTADALAA